MFTTKADDLKEFTKRQNCPYVKLDEDNQIYVFQNGASTKWGYFYDPPEDKWHRLTIQRDYYKTKLEMKELEFNNLKSQIEEVVAYSKRCNTPGPRDVDIARLKRIKNSVLRFRGKLREITEQLDQHPDAIRQRQRQESLQQRFGNQEQRFFDVERELDEIEI